jgi:hypothetical protein
MRGGVFCHRGASIASVSRASALDELDVENVHAEVRTRRAFDDFVGRSDDDAVQKRQRAGRLAAIEVTGGE